MTFTPRFTITNAIAAALTDIERARGFLLEARHTTHIEGTRLTLEQESEE